MSPRVSKQEREKMGKIISTLEQVPDALTIILDKMEKMEIEMASLKEMYNEAPVLPSDNMELIPFKEAFKYLRISERTLHNWVRDGKIPYSIIGTIRYFKISDLESYNRVEVKKNKGL